MSDHLGGFDPQPPLAGAVQRQIGAGGILDQHREGHGIKLRLHQRTLPLQRVLGFGQLLPLQEQHAQHHQGEQGGKAKHEGQHHHRHGKRAGIEPAGGRVAEEDG
ncbi:hypothetical protein [Dyella flagellata]|uniref:hypothetical protein n=1 Tax=Dyella flagellata TaxID=1867833 RepID=UPI0024E15EF2|nr:hypothetical protein [Dyella flagellata]